MQTNAENTPLFCVIVLVYNDLPYCRGAIDSVLAQSDGDFELVIVDNGSTDGTHEAIQQYLSDRRVRIVRQARNQRSDAAQFAAESCTTEFLTFLFADDRYHPRRLEVAREAFAANPDAAYVFFNSEFIDDEGRLITEIPHTQFRGDISSMDRFGHLHHFITTGNSLHPCGMVVKTLAYKKAGGFPRTMHYVGDMVFFSRLLGDFNGLFLRDRMQSITLWNNRKNESLANVAPTNQLVYERSVLLENFLRSPILDNIGKIYEKRQSKNIAFGSKSERLWFIGQQLIRQYDVDCKTVGFRALHEAAAGLDEKFETDFIAATGLTISEYISDAAKRNRVDYSDNVPQRGSVLDLLSPSLHKEVGRFLCTIGFKRVGTGVYRRSEERVALRGKRA